MNVKDTIEQLKQQGFTVHVRHERPILVPVPSTRRFDETVGEDTGLGTRHELDQVRRHNPGAYFGMKGGVTTVDIGTEDGPVARGYAYCRPDDEVGPGDQFNRKLGTRIALGRALKELEATQ